MTTSPEPVTTKRQFGDATGVELFTAYQAYKSASATERLAAAVEVASVQAAQAAASEMHDRRLTILRAGEAARRAIAVAGTTPELLARVNEAELLAEEMERELARAFDSQQREKHGDDRQLVSEREAAAKDLDQLSTPSRGRLAFHILGSLLFASFGLRIVGDGEHTLLRVALAMAIVGSGLASFCYHLSVLVPSVREKRQAQAEQRLADAEAEMARRGLRR